MGGMIELKASDLRIGNIIGVTGFINGSPDGNSHHEILKNGFTGGIVSEVHSEIIILENRARINLDNIKPIPITEEELLKFEEFSHSEEDHEYLDCKIKTGLIIFHRLRKEISVGSSANWHHLENIQCIHQLQNLYHALTGKELTIN